MKLLIAITACFVANLYRERLDAARTRKKTLEGERKKWEDNPPVADETQRSQVLKKYEGALNEVNNILKREYEWLDAIETEMRKEGINVKAGLLQAFKDWAKG